MIRFGFALATAALALACTTALADPPAIRKYTVGDLYLGSGDPKTPLVRGDNPIPNSTAQINCSQPSCQVAVTFKSRYCASLPGNYFPGFDFATKIYVDGTRLVLGDWVLPDFDRAGCRVGVWVGNFEIHSGNHLVTLDTYDDFVSSQYPATQGAWQVSYQVGIPNP